MSWSVEILISAMQWTDKVQFKVDLSLGVNDIQAGVFSCLGDTDSDYLGYHVALLSIARGSPLPYLFCSFAQDIQ